MTPVKRVFIGVLLGLAVAIGIAMMLPSSWNLGTVEVLCLMPAVIAEVIWLRLTRKGSS
jgi:TctA family transporter